MDRVIYCLTTYHDPWLVALAIFLCGFALLTAIRLYERSLHGGLSKRINWLFLSGLATGIGIWATHFVAMLAYDYGGPEAYEPGYTVLSLFVAICASGVGFAIAGLSRSNVVAFRAVGGGFLGLGISAMHYTGMAGLRVAGTISWMPDLAIASIILGVGLAMVALVAAGDCRTRKQKILGGLTLAAAIVALHFTAMGAVVINPDPQIEVPSALISQKSLAIAVTSVTLLVLGAGLITGVIEKQLRAESENELRMISDTAIEGLVITRGGKIINTNGSFLDLVGKSFDDVIGHDFLTTWLPDHDRAFEKRESAYAETTLNLNDQETIPVEIIRRQRHNTTDDELTTVYAIRDLRERNNAEAHIQYLAEHDPLTGVLNRVTYLNQIQVILTKAKFMSTRLTIISVDIDRFRDLNQSFGHPNGDHMLRILGERLRDFETGRITAGRLTSNQFSCAIQFEPREDHRTLSEHLASQLHAVLTQPILLKDKQVIQPSISMGIAMYPTDATDHEELLSNAELAQQRAKQYGGNDVVFFAADLHADYVEHRQIIRAMSDAIRNREFELYYQPQCKTVDGTVVGFEALVRWKSSKFGFVPPSRFIPIAEETGQIVELGEWILRTACAQAASWRNPLRIAVNISTVQLQQSNIVETISDALRDGGLPADRLELEITETAMMTNPTQSLYVLQAIKQLGVKIALDDFGTGYSSLSNLRTFPVDRLKIDQSFTSNIGKQDQATSIVRALVRLSRDLDIDVIAEGVETLQQIEFLSAEKCDELQGYEFGRPSPIAAMQFLVDLPEDMGNSVCLIDPGAIANRTTPVGDVRRGKTA